MNAPISDAHTRRVTVLPWARSPLDAVPHPVRLFRDMPESASVGRLRHSITGALEDYGGTHLADTVAQVASELLTNALQHGRLGSSPLIATLARRESTLVLAVHDKSHHRPAPKHPGPDCVGGRGMALVAQLADAWGYWFTAVGKTVTAEFTLVARTV